MVASLRYFYIFCFFGIIALVFVGGDKIRSYIEDRVIHVVGHQISEVSLQRFLNEYWTPHRLELNLLPCHSNSCPDVKTLESRFKARFKDLPLYTYRLYRNDEKAGNLFNGSSFFADPLTDDLAKEAFATASKGNVSSYIDHEFITGDGVQIVLRMFYPIIPDSSNEQSRQRIPAILETTYNLTPLWSGAEATHMYIIVALSLFFLVLFISIYYYVNSTERLLAGQYETNVKLETEKSSAEEENQAKSQFLANISHELRTPLNAIIGFSEIIKDEVMGPLNNQQYKDYITDIYLSGIHLLSLINDILDYSKAEAGKLTIDMEDVDVTKVMKNSIRLVMPRAKDAGVELIANIPKEHYILHTDGKRLKQIILNLLSNSVKFTESGGKVTLSGWSNVQDNTFCVEVEDTGVGIAAKDISKVMSTFGQIENKLSRKYEGTGLGLPLTKKLTELMGGQFAIRSELNVGTAVTITLPYIDPGKKAAESAGVPQPGN